MRIFDEFTGKTEVTQANDAGNRVVQVAMMFIVLTPDFNILVNLLPLPTATEQIIELLTECGGT